MNVLGISCFYHDAAAALVVDGKLIAAAEEERFSRKKHDFEFPRRAIEFCLKTADIVAGELDLVVFYEKPFWKLDRILMSAIQTFPRSLGAFREGMLVWLLDKLWVRDQIVERLGVPRQKVAFSSHHTSHAASSYYCSGFDEAAILTVDGVGEWAAGTRGVAFDDTIELTDQLSYPHSLGLLYSVFTAFLGFQVNEGEYKVMGLAPYGNPRFVDLIFDKLVDLHDDGSFWLDMDYFAYHHSAVYSFNERFAKLFGAPRSATDSNTLDPHYADVAASIQRVAEEILVRQARSLKRRTGHTNLCMAGGVALNSVANARILGESGFSRLFIQPAAGDGGGALGAALWGAHTVLREKRAFRMEHASWGEAHDDAAIARWLRGAGHEYRELDDDALYGEVAARLVNGQVVGWMDGRFEWGPRALGHRSILADPRDALMKDVVNARIKFREPFRPFAPSVLAERAEEFFRLPDAPSVDPARYMLLVVPVVEERRETLGAITHVDGTARIQAVHRDVSPRYHRVIARFGELTGVPVVLNTSFNLRGEPIVNTPAEAFSTFERSDMDAVVMGHFVVSRRAVGEGRNFQGVDLEQWRAAPGTSPAPAALDSSPEGASGARSHTAAGHTAGGHNLFGAAAPLPRSHAWGTRIVHGIATGIAGAFCVALILELLLRMMLPIPNLQLGGMYRLDSRGVVALRPYWHTTVRGHEFDTPIRINASGLRDRLDAPLPSRKHLLVLGDSFTFGCWSTERRRFVGVMAQALGRSVQVMCGAQPDWGTASELDFLEHRGRRLKPDAVLLAFYDGNDYWDNFVGPSATTVEGGYLKMRQPWWSKELACNCLRGGMPQGEPLLGPCDPAPSTLLRSPWAPPTDGSAAESPRIDGGWGHHFLAMLRHTELFQVGAALHLSFETPERFLRPYDAQAWMLRSYRPEMARAVLMTWRYLDAMMVCCRKMNVPLAVVVIPSHTEVDDSAWHAWLVRNHLASLANRFRRARPRQMVVSWARARGVPVLDLASCLANRPGLYYHDDMHWTDLGHFQAGEHVARFVRSLGWLP